MIDLNFKNLKKVSFEFLFSLFLKQNALILLQDACLLGASLYVSLLLRLGENFSDLSPAVFTLNAFLYVLFGMSVFLGRRVYKGLWTPPSWGEWFSIAISVSYITVLYFPLMFLLPKDYALPDSTPFINWFVAIAFLGLPRLATRLYQKQTSVQCLETSSPRQRAEVNITDFLGRKSEPFNEVAVRSLIKGKRILITGAGGTIGAALAKRVAGFSPAHLCLVDHSESLLYAIGLDVRETFPNVPCDTLLGDVTFRDRIRHVMGAFRPELVFHAAALKQVPIVEENLSQAVLTNVIGTQNVADACRDFKVRSMLLISTHETIHPVNTMGATKRLGESYCQSLDTLERKKANGTRYACVGFGNILGAEGSVIPLFKRQIQRGGPLTITHAEMVRYFIPLHEAVNLSLHAMTLATNLEVSCGKVFFLDMGNPLKIMDLAKWLIFNEGLNVGEDIQIKVIGLRPGEQLIEKMPLAPFMPTSHPKIFLNSPRTMDYGFLMRAFHELEDVAKTQDRDSLLRLLQVLVPEYQGEKVLPDASLEEVG